MRILIDSREQRPLAFRHPTVREKLPVGDYACSLPDDSVVPVMFERKSIGDLFGTMSQGYERFRREIARAKEYDIKLVLIVEGSLRDVLRGYSRSQRSGASVLKQIFFLQAKYNLHTVFCPDRAVMSTYISHVFEAYRRLRGK